MSNYPGGFTATVAGPISGPGMLTKTDGGVLILTNTSNTWSGGLSVTGGVIDFGDNSFPTNFNSSPLIVGAAGTLALPFGGPSDYTSGQVASFLAASSGSFAAGAGFGLDTTNLSGTYGNNIAGSFSFAKLGTNTLTLTGSNSYTGSTFIDAGILSLGSSNALGSTSAVTFNGGTLQYSGSNTTDYSNLIKNSGAAVSIDTSGQNVTWTGTVAASNTAGFIKNGLGTLTMFYPDPYTGNTVISSGTLQVGSTKFTTYTAPQLIVNSGGAFDANGQSVYWIGAVTGNGLITSSVGNGEIGMNGANQTGTFSGNMTNIAFDYRQTNSTWTLSGSSSINGNFFNVITNSGTVSLTGTMTTGAGDWIMDGRDAGGTFIVNGGYVNIGINGGVRVGWGAAYDGGTLGPATFILNSGSVVTPTVSSQFNRPISSGSESFLLNGGVLQTPQIAIDGFGYNAVGDPAFVFAFNGGTLNVSNNGTIFKDAGNGGSNGTGGSAGGVEVAVQISGSGAPINLMGFNTVSQVPLMDVTGSNNAGPLSVSGGGSLNLSGTGTFTGRTSISGGSIVRISRDGNLGIAPASNVANQVDLNGGTLSLNSYLNGATLTSGSGLLTSASNYQPGNVIGSPVVTNQTGAYIKLNNSIYALVPTGTSGSGLITATVTIAPPDLPGGIQATASATLTNGTLSGYSIINPGSGYSIAPSIYVALTGSADVAPGNPTYQFQLTGSNPTIWSEGIVTGNSPGLTMSGYSSPVTGTVTTSNSITLAATRGIQLDAGGGTLDVANFPTGFTATVNGPISGIGALTKTSAGVLVLTASNSYSGGTIIAGGTLQAENAYALGNAPAPLAVNAGTLDLYGHSLTATMLSGTGAGLITTSQSGNIGLTINGTGSGTYNGTIMDGPSGKLS